jgi:tyrosyl-tRNA synthetase
MHKPTNAELTEFLTRRTDKIIGEKELRKLLTSGTKLTVKFGVDVTSPDIHIGHAVNLWMMRQLQEWGHKVIFLIGGFTTKIGDPTGRDATRKEISDAEIKKNAKKYIEQVGRVLLTNPSVFEIRNNDDWFGRMKTSEFLGLLGQVTHAQLIERDMFQKRLRENKEIRMHEMVYPIVQGYDSVMLKDQICLCGTDQLFNEMMGRFFQERAGQMPQTIITGNILVGTDGIQKMSKSLGNYIGITDTPNDKYGKVMSVADSAIYDYFRLATNVSAKDLAKIKKDLPGLNPRDLKMRLAHTLVSLYDGESAADKAQTNFVKIFQEHQLPSKIPSHKLTKPTLLLDLLVDTQLASSKSEARRLIQQGGVSIDERVTNDITLVLKPKTPAIIQVGKRRFLKLI